MASDLDSYKRSLILKDGFVVKDVEGNESVHVKAKFYRN